MLNWIFRIFLVLLVGIQICEQRCFAIDNETGQYLQAMARKCLHNYFQLAEWGEGIVSESFILNSDGTVSQISITAHPKHYKTKRTTVSTDKALILAVKNAAPFQKPPSSLHTPVKLVLTFDLTDLDKPVKASVKISR